jgi:glucosamine kinase
VYRPGDTTMSKHLFIGMDGGATSCRARIRDIGGNLLGEGRGGPANIHVDLPLAVNHRTKRSLDGAILMARRAFLPHTYTIHPNSRALAFAARHA